MERDIYVRVGVRVGVVSHGSWISLIDLIDIENDIDIEIEIENDIDIDIEIYLITEAAIMIPIQHK